MAKSKQKSKVGQVWKKMRAIAGWQWALLIATVFLGLFVWKMPRTIVGYGDSDMLITMGYRLGVVRSPGYPLYTLLLYGFTHLPLVEPALGGHLLSAVLTSLSVGVVFLIAWTLALGDREKRGYVLGTKEWERWLLAVVVSLGFGFSSLVWSMALVAEKFALSGLLMALWLWLSIYVANLEKKRKQKILVAMGLVLGLALSHQWIFGALVPVYGWSLYKNRRSLLRRDWLLALSALVGAFIAPFGLLWIYSANGVNLSYIVDGSLTGLWSFVSPSYLGDGQSALSAGSGWSLGNTVVNVWEFARAMVADVGWWLAAAGAGVMVYVYRKKKQDDFATLLATLILVLVGLSVVLAWPEAALPRLEVRPQLLVLELAAVVLCWFGWRELVVRLGAAGVVLFENKTRVAVGLSAVMVAVVLASGLIILNRKSLADYTVQENLNKELLVKAEKGAVMTCYSSVACGGLAYEQLVKGEGEGVTLVPYGYLPGVVKIGEDDLQGFSYNTFPFVLYDIVTWNVGKRTVYAVDIFQSYVDLLGINFGFMYFVPEGYMGRLDRELPGEFVPSDYKLAEKLVEGGGGDWKLLTDGLTADLARRHVLNASIYLKAGLRTRATDEVNVASNMYHLFGDSQQQEILTVREDLEKNLKSKYYELGRSVSDVDFIIGSVAGLVEVKLIGRALEVAQGAVTVDPTNIEARLTFAKTLAIASYKGRAIEEYQNVLRLDPSNAEARGELRKLSNPEPDTKPELFN